MSLSSNMCMYVDTPLKSDLYKYKILSKYNTLQVQIFCIISTYWFGKAWCLLWSLDLFSPLMYLASHGKDGDIKCVCDLNNGDLQEGENWGGETLCCSLRETSLKVGHKSRCHLLFLCSLRRPSACWKYPWVARYRLWAQHYFFFF